MTDPLADYGIYTHQQFLTPDECRHYIDYVNHPPSDSDAFTDNGQFRNFKVICPAIANSFYKRLIDFQTEDRGRPFLRANHYVMAGHYTVGARFGLHTDTGLYYNVATKEASRWTLLIYLNDDYTGGYTRFFSDDGETIGAVQPKAGMAVVFDIDRWHQGEAVTAGEKFWVGCEIIGSLV
jgi:hypothetical protein